MHENTRPTTSALDDWYATINHGPAAAMSPREIQVARQLEIRGSFTPDQLTCHERTRGRHFLTATMCGNSDGTAYRHCIQCSARLPGDYDNTTQVPPR